MVEKKKSACELVRERRVELAKKAMEASPEKKEKLRQSITERLGQRKSAETATRNGGE
jgi:hypothetical protein